MIKQTKNCVSCYACMNICPVKCITKSDTGGVAVDVHKCIKCNKCEEVCQLYCPSVFNEPRSVYAAIRKSGIAYLASSSGGVASAMAEAVIKGGGVVFGTKYNEKLEPIITSVNRLEDLELIRKSKYCFSDTDKSYIECQRYCDNGTLVLYIGLPCQIAGLLSFLPRKYDNLVTVDLLCHGAPSLYTFKEHISYLEEKYSAKIVNYEFRDKSNDKYGPYSFLIKFADGKTIRGSAIWDSYYKHFLSSDILRECCYSCQYAQKARVGDVSVGDFWKVGETIHQFSDYKYVSSVIINTQKGEKVFGKCQDELELYSSSIEELAKSTHAVVYPPRASNRKSVIEKLKKMGYFRWAYSYEHSLSVKLRKYKYRYLKFMK